MEKDYYKILGITDEEKKLQGEDFNKLVGKKYKKLALKYHPDRHVNDTEEEKKDAEEKFKEINEANTVLSNEDSRRRYDNGGMDGNSFEDFMQNFGGFGGFGDFFGFGGNRGNYKRQEVGDDVQVNLNMTLKQAFNGGKTEIPFTKKVKCTTCNGSGSSDGITHTCSQCNGSGVVISRVQRGNMTSITNTTCPKCHGTGKEVISKCNDCNGSGLRPKSLRYKIDIPKGMGNNETLRVSQGGSEPAGDGVNGDLYITVRIAEDSYFTRNEETGNANLLHIMEVPINEALLGFNKEVDTIDGGKVVVRAEECTEDGKVFTFEHLGMTTPHSENRGNYYVVIKYKYPEKLTEKQKELLKAFNE